MRQLGILLLISLVACTATYAQEETLVGSGFESGGFGAPVVKITPIRGNAGVFAGVRGGWIINHTFVLGGGGYGLVTDITAATPGPGGEPYLNVSYGGLELEYIRHWDRLAHFSFGTLVGGGVVGTRLANGSNSGDTRSFFVMEPWVDGNLNVTDFFRVSAGISYRWVAGGHSPAASDGDLSGIALNLLLRFGSF